MNSKPLVSVIIIFLNAEEYFEEAIQSIFSQNYDHWELLLVDDGSSTVVRKSPKFSPGNIQNTCVTWSMKGIRTWA